MSFTCPTCKIAQPPGTRPRVVNSQKPDRDGNLQITGSVNLCNECADRILVGVIDSASGRK